MRKSRPNEPVHRETTAASFAVGCRTDESRAGKIPEFKQIQHDPGVNQCAM